MGLVGLGMMGKNHARILSSLEGVELVGVYDVEVNVLKQHKNMAVFDNLQDLIEKGLDYAVVAVPTKFHLSTCEILAQSGIHALIEKPLSYDLESSRKILKIYSDKSLVGAVGHVERFNPATIEAKNRLAQLGRIMQISTMRQGPFPNRISDVGVIKDLATHDIDLVSWITGSKYQEVSAHTSFKSGREHEDMLISIAQLENEVIVNHIVNWVSPMKERSISIIGENGLFKIDTLWGI